jgi:quercetin dioxygenase-like cupin family protein
MNRLHPFQDLDSSPFPGYVPAGFCSTSSIQKGISMRRILLPMAFVLLWASVASAQDPVRVDPKHYEMVSQNDQVRILRIHYGPKERSVMHEHPNSVVVFLTDAHVKFNLPDGTSQEETGKKGDSRFTPAGKHNPENLGDKPFDAILIELKAKAASHPAAKAPPKKSS